MPNFFPISGKQYAEAFNLRNLPARASQMQAGLRISVSLCRTGASDNHPSLPLKTNKSAKICGSEGLPRFNKDIVYGHGHVIRMIFGRGRRDLVIVQESLEFRPHTST